MRKRRPRPSRDRILDAAVALIAAHGYGDTTVGDIEEAAGLTRRAGGFYRHFASKEEVLVQAVEHMAREMIGEIRLADVTSLKSPRAELLVIARSLMRHAEAYRPLRLILWREGHKLPALRKAAQRANARLAALDVVPWVEDVFRRSGIAKRPAREFGLMMFGPVILHILSLDRGDPAFGLQDDGFLDPWAEHWTAWLAAGGPGK
jgi:AcrR family transcriptional regulator